MFFVKKQIIFKKALTDFRQIKPQSFFHIKFLAVKKSFVWCFRFQFEVPNAFPSKTVWAFSSQLPTYKNPFLVQTVTEFNGRLSNKKYCSKNNYQDITV